MEVEDQIEFYSKNDVCPTCDQSIGEDHKKFLLSNTSEKKRALRIMREAYTKLGYDDYAEKVKALEEVN